MFQGWHGGSEPAALQAIDGSRVLAEEGAPVYGPDMGEAVGHFVRVR
jgi:hypothetical protein